MELRVHKKKRVGSHIKPQRPFPIDIESEDDLHIENPCFVGTFNNDCVVVCNPEEMNSLYTMGFFGKGSFSRGYPSFGLNKKSIPPVIKERQWKRRKSWINKMKQNLTCSLKSHVDGNSSKSNAILDSELLHSDQSKTTNNLGNETSSMDIEAEVVHSFSLNPSDCKLEDSKNTNSDFYSQVLVLADSDDEDIEAVIRDPQPHLEDELIKTAVETLNLMLEEAFFLSFGLGCLQVVDLTGQPMNIKRLWETCCEINPNFIESYVAYHHFRAKGWVVKSGFKFGGDFLLYKQGPAFYHASYVVIIERLDHELRRYSNSITWTKLHGLNRLAENSGKDIIICQVVFPEDIMTEELKSPTSLSKYQVNEILTKRWIFSQEREEKEQT